MWLEVGASNNNPSIIAQYFVDCVRQIGGTPKMIRADCGTESTYIAALQRFFRRDGNGKQWLPINVFCRASKFPIKVLKHGGVYLGGAVQTGGFAFLKI